MTEQKKPAEAPKAWRGKPGYEHWGEIPKGPERYPDSAGKRFGNWLLNALTPWRR